MVNRQKERSVSRDLKLDQIQAQLDELASKVSNDAVELYDSIVQNVSEIRNDVLDEIEELAEKGENFINNNPYKSTIIGLVLGAVVGLVLGVLF